MALEATHQGASLRITKPKLKVIFWRKYCFIAKPGWLIFNVPFKRISLFTLAPSILMITVELCLRGNIPELILEGGAGRPAHGGPPSPSFSFYSTGVWATCLPQRQLLPRWQLQGRPGPRLRRPHLLPVRLLPDPWPPWQSCGRSWPRNTPRVARHSEIAINKAYSSGSFRLHFLYTPPDFP